MAKLLLEMKLHVPPHLHARVQLKWMNKADRQAFEKEPYQWMIQQRAAFVVHFWKAGLVDHALCVDGI